MKDYLDEFKQYRAKLRRCIRKAKRDYYTSIFNPNLRELRVHLRKN